MLIPSTPAPRPAALLWTGLLLGLTAAAAPVVTPEHPWLPQVWVLELSSFQLRRLGNWAGLADWHYAVPTGAAFDHDPEKAKQLLDAAGYRDDGSGVRAKDGKRMEFRIIAIATTDVDVCAAKLVVDAAAEVGIKLELQTLDETTLGDTVYNTDAPNWDLFVWGWDSGTADPSYMLGVPLCDQIGNNNDVFYCDDTYDADYAKQAQTVDTAARKAITDRMQQRFYESATYLVMWYQDKLQAYRTDTWTGWQEIPGGVIFNFTRDNYLTIQPAG